MGEVLAARRQSSKDRLSELKGRLDEAKTIAERKACVYATGSFGRGEASEHSDLDLFIVGESVGGKPALRNLDEICLKAELIRATKAQGLPEFDGDGRWLQQNTVDELIGSLGKPEDDAANTFTARLLLLLESHPILGDDVYDECIARVVTKYWRDYEDHQNSFLPVFLANDIMRLWRTFCVNYEARTEIDPPEKKAKRKLKNYKLKHSRLLTCYSALAFMLAHVRACETFHPADAKKMVKLSPTERLECLASDARFDRAGDDIAAVLEKYERFLEVTGRPTEDLIHDFMNRKIARARYTEAVELGDAMLQVLRSLGEGSAFYRLLLV